MLRNIFGDIFDIFPSQSLQSNNIEAEAWVFVFLKNDIFSLCYSITLKNNLVGQRTT